MVSVHFFEDISTKHLAVDLTLKSVTIKVIIK